VYVLNCHKSYQKWCRKTGELNSNVPSDFKLKVVTWSQLRMHSEKSSKWAKSSIGQLNFLTCIKLMLLNPFSVKYWRPEVELMHSLLMCRHYCHVWNTHHWTDSEFAWTLACFM